MLTQSETICINKNCQIKYTFDFLSNIFPKKIIYTDLLNHQANTRFKLEMTKIKEYQDIILVHNQLSKELKFEVKYLENIKHLTNEKKDELYSQLNIEELDAIYYNYMSSGLYDKELIYNTLNKEKYVNNNHINIKCPIENCKGFLDDKYYCSLCKNDICKECRSKYEKNHICNKDNIELIKIVNAECKNCPKCGINIQKTEGCNQMFCVNCKTKFNYETGIIYSDNDLFHNPHYIEFQNKKNNKCELTNLYLDDFLKSYEKINFTELIQDYECLLHRHIINYDIIIRKHIMRHIIKNESEVETVKKIQKSLKRIYLHIELEQLKDLYINCIYDIVTNILDKKKSPDTYELDSLHKYINKQLIDKSRKFNIVLYPIIYGNRDNSTLSFRNGKMVHDDRTGDIGNKYLLNDDLM
jgi:hypothetical protein